MNLSALTDPALNSTRQAAYVLNSCLTEGHGQIQRPPSRPAIDHDGPLVFPCFEIFNPRAGFVHGHESLVRDCGF